MSPESLDRAMGAIALAVGVGAGLAPNLLLRLYGVGPGSLNGPGELGWRLFAARNLVVGTAAVRGVPLARELTLLVQVPDQLVFLHAYRTRSIPRPTALAAMATSAAVIATGLLSRSRAGGAPA